MVQKFIFYCWMLIPVNLFAQQINGTLSHFNNQTAEVVLFPFGMDKPVNIGSVTETGTIHINLDSFSNYKFSKEERELFLSDLSSQFFTNCDDARQLKLPTTALGINCQTPALWKDGQWIGNLFPVSEELLLPWMEDRYYAEPVKASFYQIIYVDNTVIIKKDCVTTYNLVQGNIETLNSYDMSLKKGFNLVGYSIKEIYKTNPEETSSIPKLLEIRSPGAAPEIKWVAKYF